MITHKYIGEGEYVQGLPAADLDENMLDDQQRTLLERATASGLYRKERARKASSNEPTTKDTSQ